MILPKILIYKERYLLDEFHVYEEGPCMDLFNVLQKCPDVVWEYNGALEDQYLSIFNAAYYIWSDMLRHSYPALKINEYADYISRHVHAHYRKVEAVLCVVRALMLNHPSSSVRQGLKDAIHKKAGDFYDHFFTLLPVTFHDHYPVPPSDAPALTKDYLERHCGEMKWREWTNGYAQKEVYEIVTNAGRLKEEKLNLLDAILEDAGKNGCRDAEAKFAEFRAKLEGMEDSILRYFYRPKESGHVACAPEPVTSKPAPAPKQDDTSAKRIQELEAEIKSLRAQLKKLEEENKRKDDYIARMKTQMQELGKRAGNDFNFDFDNPVGTAIGHVENLTIKYEKP